MKVTFLKDHDHRISPAVVKAYKAGCEDNIPKALAEQLIRGGVAVADAPAKKET